MNVSNDEDMAVDIFKPGAQAEFTRCLYVFERDTKYLHIFDLQSRVLEKKLLNI